METALSGTPTSIIIPTLNEEDYLPLLLDSLLKVSSPVDVIVVDGQSEDATQAVVRSYQEKFSAPSSLRLVEATERGISRQRNTGAAAAKHDILLFVDADVIIRSDESYQRIINRFIKKDAVVATPLLWPAEPGFGYKVVFIFAVLVQYCMYLLRKPYFSGACLITTRAVFEKNSGFDETILLAEDVDYSLRAAKHGTFTIIRVSILTSARRIMKQGYWWLFKELPKVLPLLFTGKIDPTNFYYPFGEFSKEDLKKTKQ